MKIWTVDAFTDVAYRGNPAGVMIVPAFPADHVCQAIAMEMNLAETAFVKKLGPDYFHIRWFTPKIEVQLCGHATLAAAYILLEQGLVQGDLICFDSLSGELRVNRAESGLTLDFPLQEVSSPLPLATFQRCLSLQHEVIAAVKAHDDIIVELNSADAVKNLQPNIAAISELDCRGLIVTAKGDAPYDFISRFFAPRVGIVEDPVTGSAHCKLADYWQKKLSQTQFFAYQASSRGGEIRIEVKGKRVLLTGKAVVVMEGVWKQTIAA